LDNLVKLFFSILDRKIPQNKRKISDKVTVPFYQVSTDVASSPAIESPELLIWSVVVV
jgi:hypothetical protein